MDQYNIYNIGEFVVLHLSERAKKNLLAAYEEDGVFNLGDYDENEVEVVAQFPGVGQGTLV